MFFSKLARLFAIATIVLGLLSVLLGAAATMGSWGPDEIARYGSPGKAIDRGIYAVLFSAALGTLAEISFSIRKLASLADFDFSTRKFD